MQNFDKLKVLLGSEAVLERLTLQSPMVPFAEETILFFEQFSKEIRNHPEAKKMADAAAFGFWCRKAHLLQLKKWYGEQMQNALGKGVTLHFAPSNIPVLFAYSMSAALLAGNCCMVRLSSRKTPQEEALLECLSHTLHCLPEWKNRIVLFRYEYDRKLTDALSLMCDVRVIWGGDESVSEIRRSSLPPRAVELPFPDRRSAAVINAAAVLHAKDLEEMVRGFYNDTYRYDQNACSSPGLLYWIGEESQVKAAKERFWKELFAYIKPLYTLSPVLAVKKWEAAMYLAALEPDTEICAEENIIVRVKVKRLLETYWDMFVPGGFFLEAQGNDLRGLLPVLTKKCQTLTCFGVSGKETADFLMENRVTGVDRITEFGHALDFSLVWDGMDLIDFMTRRISLV